MLIKITSIWMSKLKKKRIAIVRKMSRKEYRKKNYFNKQ